MNTHSLSRLSIQRCRTQLGSALALLPPRGYFVPASTKERKTYPNWRMMKLKSSLFLSFLYLLMDTTYSFGSSHCGCTEQGAEALLFPTANAELEIHSGKRAFGCPSLVMSTVRTHAAHYLTVWTHSASRIGNDRKSGFVFQSAGETRSGPPPSSVSSFSLEFCRLLVLLTDQGKNQGVQSEIIICQRWWRQTGGK